MSFFSRDTAERDSNVDGLLKAFGGWSDDPEGVDEFIKKYVGCVTFQLRIARSTRELPH